MSAPLVPQVILPQLAPRDERALRALRDDDAFVSDVAWARAWYAHDRQRHTVAHSEVAAWLDAKAAELARAQTLCAELASLRQAAPPGVRAWLMQAAADQGRPAAYLELERRAMGALDWAEDVAGLVQGARKIAETVKPGRGRPRTDALLAGATRSVDRIAAAWALEPLERAEVERIVLFDMVPDTLKRAQRTRKK